MIRHMYGLDFENRGINRDHVSPLLFAVEVYQTADYYRVPQLKQRAKEKAEEAAKICWEMNDFPTAIAETYTTIPEHDRELRAMLVEVSRKHIKKLLQDPGFLEVLEETNGFAADLSKVLAVLEKPLARYRCPNCATQWSVERCTGIRKLSHCPFCGCCSDWEGNKC